jgi:cytochrome c-type biogenesis protein CcmH
MRTFLFAFILMLVPAVSWAGEAQDMAKDPAVEKRLVNLASKMRCLVCQNESLEASHAELAQDLRRNIREQIKAGKTDQEITDYMVARYGDFVLYEPRVKSYTLPLWGLPFLFMLGGALFLVYQVRRRRKVVAEPELSEEQQRRAAALLEGDEKQ